MNQIEKINCVHHILTQGVSVQAAKKLPSLLSPAELGIYADHFNTNEYNSMSPTRIVRAIDKYLSIGNLRSELRNIIALHADTTTPSGMARQGMSSSGSRINAINIDKIILRTEDFVRFGTEDLIELLFWGTSNNGSRVTLKCENKNKLEILKSFAKNIIEEKETELFNLTRDEIDTLDIDTYTLIFGDILVAYDARNRRLYSRKDFTPLTEEEKEEKFKAEIKSLLLKINKRTGLEKTANVNVFKREIHDRSTAFIREMRKIHNKIDELRDTLLTEEALLETINLIKGINGIEKVVLSNDKIIIYTEKIVIDYINPSAMMEEVKNKGWEDRLVLGKYEIVIDIAEHRILSRTDAAHPHINNHVFCFGSISHTINAALAEADYFLLAQNLMTYLRSYNQFSQYYSLIGERWCESCNKFKEDCICDEEREEGERARTIAEVVADGEAEQPAAIHPF